MKTKVITAVLGLFLVNAFAQDRTTVSATSSEISDNLDLRAVASIFGDSKDLEDFENRLNDPKNQISNLDLNGDNQVDYIRVIESVEGRTHIIVLQSVLGKDLFQDIASVEVEKDSNNRVQVQVVGDVYMYGANYIYEPVYVSTPIIYNYFWVSNYRPYYSSWYWGYYPSYYYAWTPFPIFRYRSHIGLYINHNHHYNYVNYRRCHVAYTNYYGRRANGYERQYPNRSFSSRNSGYTNRYELDRTRNIRTVGSGNRSEVASANPRSGGRTEATPNTGGPRTVATPRNTGGGRTEATPNTGGPRTVATPRNTGGGRTEATPNTGGPRAIANPRTKGTVTTTNDSGPRVSSTPRSQSTAGSPRVNSTPRSQSSTTGSPRMSTSGSNDGNPRVSTSSGSNPRSGSYNTPQSTPRSSGNVSSPRNSGSSGMSSAPRGNSGGGNSSRGNSGGNGSRR